MQSSLRQYTSLRNNSKSRFQAIKKSPLFFNDNFNRSINPPHNNWTSITVGSYFNGVPWHCPGAGCLEMYADGTSPGTSTWDSICYRNLENYSYPGDFEVKLRMWRNSGAGSDSLLGVSFYGTEDLDTGLGVKWYIFSGIINFVAGQTIFYSIDTTLVAIHLQEYWMKVRVSGQKVRVKIWSARYLEEPSDDTKNDETFQLIEATCPFVHNQGDTFAIRGMCRSAAYGYEFMYLDNLNVYKTSSNSL